MNAFLDALAARTPTPGGGAAAGAAGAVAAAQAEMVVAFSIGKKALAQHEPALREAHGRLRRARALLLQLAEEDAHAFDAVGDLMKLPEDDARRRRDMPAAAAAAVRIPQTTIAACVDLLRLLEELAPICNPRLLSDLAVAATLAAAGARASRWNVVVNRPLLEEAAGRDGAPSPQDAVAETDAMLRRGADLLRSVENACSPPD